MESDARQENDFTGSDCAEVPIINKIILSTPISHGKFPITEHSDDQVRHEKVCACGSPFSMGRTLSNANSSQNCQIGNQNKITAFTQLRNPIA
jgi:hypothetical protein